MVVLGFGLVFHGLKVFSVVLFFNRNGSRTDSKLYGYREKRNLKKI